MCVVCVSIKRLKRVARRAVWVSSRVHAWRGASRLMHARHTRVRVPHSSLLPCTEPPELRAPRRADLGRGPTQKPPPCAERRAPSAVGVARDGSGRRGLFVAGTSIVATSTCRPALRPATQAATLTVPKPKADTHGRAPSSPRHRVPPPHTVYKNHDKHSQSAQTPLDPY